MEVTRYYLKIESLNNLKDFHEKKEDFTIHKEKELDIGFVKFLYKEIGKDFHWRDRLIWSDQDWYNFISRADYQLYTLRTLNDLIGYYEVLSDKEKNFEISYFGIFRKYFGKKIGSYLLSHAIKNLFNQGAKKIWVHTCTLDHPNALNNYLSRGMEVYKEEKIEFQIT